MITVMTFIVILDILVFGSLLVKQIIADKKEEKYVANNFAFGNNKSTINTYSEDRELGGNKC